jgi:dTDP-4-dehydrorhamnose reductase
VEKLTEPSNALNVYGKTKAAAENEIFNGYHNSLIIRTNFYGWGTSYRYSFSDFIISNLRIGNKITLYTDIFYTPILREQLVKEIIALCNCNASGIFNVGSNERVSKYEFGLRIARQFNLNIELITPGLLNQDAAVVKRPKDMSLSSNKINRIIPLLRTSMDEQIKMLYDQEASGYMREVCDL